LSPQRRPIDDRGRRLRDAIVALVADDADNGAPLAGDAFPDAPAERRGRLLPVVTDEDTPTDVTPGSCSMRPAICWCMRVVASGSDTSDDGIETRSVSTSPGFTNPGLTCRMA